MKNFKFNIKIISIAMTGIILISGCSNKNHSAELFGNSPADKLNTEQTSDAILENKETGTETQNIVSTSETNNNEINQKDNVVLQEIKSFKNEIQKLLENENIEQLKEKCKNIFIILVDFIFYDGKIEGITFDELSNACKQELLKEVTIIDNLIMKKIPNYKEEIGTTVSNAYNKASELIEEGSNNIKNFAKDKLGEENYNKIKEFKDTFKDEASIAWDDLKEDVGNIYEQGKEKIKNWYENFKN